MPLKVLNPNDVRFVVMITAGPWHPDHKDWCKRDCMSFICNYFGANIKQTHNVAEIGSGKDPSDPYEGYHHLHQPIQFHKACKPFGAALKLRDHMNKKWTKIPEMPAGFSVTIHSVPRTESKEGKEPYDYICMKYIENSTKEKAIDEDGPLSNRAKDPALRGGVGEFAAQSFKNFKSLDVYTQRIWLKHFHKSYPQENICWDFKKIPLPRYENQSNSNLT